MLFLGPILNDIFSLHILELRFLFNEIIGGVEPGIKLIKWLRALLSSLGPLVPVLHITQSSLEFLLAPDKKDLFRFFVLAEDDELGNSFHIVLDIDDCIDPEEEIFIF